MRPQLSVGHLDTLPDRPEERAVEHQNTTTAHPVCARCSTRAGSHPESSSLKLPARKPVVHLRGSPQRTLRASVLRYSWFSYAWSLVGSPSRNRFSNSEVDDGARDEAYHKSFASSIVKSEKIAKNRAFVNPWKYGVYDVDPRPSALGRAFGLRKIAKNRAFVNPWKYGVYDVDPKVSST